MPAYLNIPEPDLTTLVLHRVYDSRIVSRGFAGEIPVGTLAISILAI